jgi:serine/threonine protein kinase
MKTEIEQEAKVVSWIQGHQHKNIVVILNHGWFRKVSNCYYIDMNLYDITLHDYILYHHKEGQLTLITDPGSGAAFVAKTNSVLARAQNWWTIGTHIAGGLKFMHEHNYVHRDLKPRNSISQSSSTLTVVLYGVRDKQWKLTDFGISAEATSKRGVSTVFSRGTPSYRAPELLMEEPTFNKKVDVWALGCVLHEMVTGKTAFPDDWAVRQYSSTISKISVSLPSLPQFLGHHLSENIGYLLHRNSEERPGITTVCLQFRSYCQLLSLSTATKLLEAPSFPVFEEWISLLATNVDHDKFLYQMTWVLDKKGEPEVADLIRQELVVKEAKRTYYDTSKGLQFRIAEVHFERCDYKAAAREYQLLISKGLNNYDLWHRFVQAHAAWKGIDSAIVMCLASSAKYPVNVKFTLMLCNLYAASGQFEKAVGKYMEHWGHGLAWENVGTRILKHTNGPSTISGIEVNSLASPSLYAFFYPRLIAGCSKRNFQRTRELS